MSNSKLPIAFLALISSHQIKDPKATPSPIPRTHHDVNPKLYSRLHVIAHVLCGFKELEPKQP